MPRLHSSWRGPRPSAHWNRMAEIGSNPGRIMLANRGTHAHVPDRCDNSFLIFHPPKMTQGRTPLRQARLSHRFSYPLTMRRIVCAMPAQASSAGRGVRVADARRHFLQPLSQYIQNKVLSCSRFQGTSPIRSASKPSHSSALCWLAGRHARAMHSVGRIRTWLHNRAMLIPFASTGGAFRVCQQHSSSSAFQEFRFMAAGATFSLRSVIPDSSGNNGGTARPF